MEISDQTLANALRFLVVDGINNAKSGHPGMPLGFADIATCMYRNHIKFNPQNPLWVNRDRVILSCGHGSMLLYAIFYLLGYNYSIDDLKNFRKLGSKTHGHPEYDRSLGIEATTGPIGQGVAMAVGEAIAEAKLHSMFPNEIHYKTYLIAGDGDLMEGISHEAFSLSGALNLNNLIVLYDSNDITIDGPLSITCNDNVASRFNSYGFNVINIDGHNPDEINNALLIAQTSDKPVLIICRTIIGKSAPKAGTSAIHGGALSDEELIQMREANNWPYKAFEIPDDIINTWRNFYIRNIDAFNKPTDKFNAFCNKTPDIHSFILEAKKSLKDTNISTRNAFHIVLNKIAESNPYIIGGSADLSEPTKSLPKAYSAITKENKNGQYIHYGIREHAMGAIANGIMLDKIFKTYTSTFLAFSDYMRPAIRMAAMMQIPQVFIMTHDSIGVGEDGPTHQPIEHLASFRAMPGLLVIRPGSSQEVADAVEIAFTGNKPTLLILSRQICEYSFDYKIQENPVKVGGYRILGDANPDIAIISTGTEVPLAINTAKELLSLGYKTSVISMPCVELFKEQSAKYQAEILSAQKRVFIEAGSTMGLANIANNNDILIGIDTFGSSAKEDILFEYYGFSTTKILEKILKQL